MLWFVTNEPTCRMNGKVAPCDPSSVLEDAVTTGAHYGMRFQEIYQPDLRNGDLASVIAYAADMLSTPTPPTNLGAVAVGPSSIRLWWAPATDDVGVVAYNVYRGSVKIATTRGTSFVNSGLRPDTTYAYRVSAIDAVGNESAPPATVIRRTKRQF